MLTLTVRYVSRTSDSSTSELTFSPDACACRQDHNEFLYSQTLNPEKSTAVPPALSRKEGHVEDDTLVC